MTYLDHYENYIQPELEKIDVFIKAEDPITINSISNLLDLSYYEIHNILEEHSITELNKVNFFLIMKEGSSPICQLFNREIERGCLDHYSIEDISYIYNIPYEKVANAAQELDLYDISSSHIKELLAYIPLERLSLGS